MAEIPETRVLAIASHVTSGYVGNTMATFCMQALGCEVSAIHTVNYSNHVGYGRFQGRKSTPDNVAELYDGLKKAGLDDFDVMLSGYCPSAGVVEAVGRIGRDVKLRASTKPGAFFWVLDPVMGDNGQLYVPEETVPVYKRLLTHADLILPNQFEAEVLSEVKITNLTSMRAAIAKLHETYKLPHVMITSIRNLPTASAEPFAGDRGNASAATLSIIGSTATSDFKPRLFRVTVPALPIMFSGTGDMFAALLVSRLRQAAKEANVLGEASWRSSDEVAADALPLAKATEKVLASMHVVLEDTAKYYEAAMSTLDQERESELNEGVGEEAEKDRSVQRHLRLTRSAEVRVVRNVSALRDPPQLDGFKARTIDITF